MTTDIVVTKEKLFSSSKYGFYPSYTTRESFPKKVRLWKGKAGKNCFKRRNSGELAFALGFKPGDVIGGCDGKNHVIAKITLVYAKCEVGHYNRNTGKCSNRVSNGYYLQSVEFLGTDGSCHSTGGGCIDKPDWWLQPEWQQDKKHNEV